MLAGFELTPTVPLVRSESPAWFPAPVPGWTWPAPSSPRITGIWRGPLTCARVMLRFVMERPHVLAAGGLR
jgi:hypothetical protein